ncbi:MAG TPA: ATP-binding cassette domain-containing protein, partial [Acidimicrobiales bacterium]|nr:ATP-binding cassette domain-containing protein [Acidimicrobiales bacterium]
LTVARNIGFPLRLRRMPPDEIDRRVREAARILDLEPLLDRKPGQLSGGQRQRVAMGRAIVRQPSLFLMDEPLSNLDAKLRVQMRAEIARLQRRLGVTTVYVTHDQVEAMTMGDRVAVLNAGRLQQFDAPRALYERPANMFVAGFIGSPPMNLFEATLEGGEDGVDVRLGDQTVRLPRGVLAGRPGLRGYLGSPVAVGIRPEDVFESGRGTPGGGATLRVDVDLVEALGAETIIHFRLGAPAVVPVGDSDDIGGGGGGRGAARFDARTQVGPGQTVEVTVDPERLHFFDPATSEAVR